MRRSLGAALALTVGLLASGCTTGLFAPLPPAPPKPVIDRQQASSAALARDFLALQKLLRAPPQQQMEMVGTAELDFQKTPTATRKLRLALILATPNQAGTDLPRAQRMLLELSSDPNSPLLPGERALVALELQQIGDYLTLARENRTLQAEAARAEQLAPLKHRLDGAAEQNERLKRQLAEARAKLAAIANIEKSLNERKPGRPK
jgi:hypothetical protein